MEKQDFSICKFIEEQMWFITYNDFCDRRVGIKRLFSEMTKNERLFYKWYVYSNVHMDESYKNNIWDYLNDFDEDGLELMRRKHFYKPL